ncbi:FtsX-like permease family protein [Clostridium chrysemydis]|uniref:FtsX-like permease family protein n=1 Tax=Clostridium chrysemydis TaxID=2665504 RepID=UPI003F33408B
MIRKNIFNFVIFFITCFFVIFILQTLKGGVDLINENNSLRGKADKLINISCSEDLNAFEVKKIFSDLKDVKLEKEGIFLEAFVGKSIFLNYENNIVPTLLEGRFFNKDDFSENKVVIGKNMKRLVEYRDNKGYILHKGKEWEVIGIMGSENRSTAFDDTFYINDFLSSEIKEARILLGGNQPDDNVKIIKDRFKDIERSASINIEELDTLESPLKKVFYEKKYIVIILSLLIGTLLLNIINTTNYYVLNKKKEIGIKKLLGRTKFKINLEILFEYIKIASLAFLFATIFYNALILFKVFPIELGLKYDVIIGGFSFLVIIILAVLVAIPSIIKSNRISISSIIKED